MKILYVTTIGTTLNFFKSIVNDLIHAGNSVDVAANETITPIDSYFEDLGCQEHHLSFSRSIFDFNNIKSISELKRILKESHYDIVHCHTPIASICTRLASIGFRKKGLKVYYTAHGFHFYEGAPITNWMFFFPIEWICSFFTDTLITINTEDYEFAKKHMHPKHIAYIPGVGIDTDYFKNTSIDVAEKRKSLAIPQNATLLLSIGELNANKNHSLVIRALSEINNPNIHYCVAGEGPLHEELVELTKTLKIENNVHFLGYRKDVNELYKCANFYVLPSLREGLNVSVMEALSANLPVVCSAIRGNNDLVKNEQNGFLFKSNDLQSLITCINSCLNNTNEYTFEIDCYNSKTINNEVMKLYHE